MLIRYTTTCGKLQLISLIIILLHSCLIFQVRECKYIIFNRVHWALLCPIRGDVHNFPFYWQILLYYKSQPPPSPSPFFVLFRVKRLFQFFWYKEWTIIYLILFYLLIHIISQARHKIKMKIHSVYLLLGIQCLFIFGGHKLHFIWRCETNVNTVSWILISLPLHRLISQNVIRKSIYVIKKTI